MKSELDAVLSEASHQRFAGCSVIIHEEDPAERLFLINTSSGEFVGDFWLECPS